jgi:hypothetical protein
MLFVVSWLAPAVFVFSSRLAHIHRATFDQKLRENPSSINPALVMAMCALAGRFVPALAEFCEANGESTDYYGKTARRLVFDAIDNPSQEICTAMYMLGVADWSAGNGKRSWMMTGMAIRSKALSFRSCFMANHFSVGFLLGLHLEETHSLPEAPTTSDFIRAEGGRRLFWTMYINE